MLDRHQVDLVLQQRPMLNQLTKTQRRRALYKRSSFRTSRSRRHMITNLAPGRVILTNARYPLDFRRFPPDPGHLIVRHGKGGKYREVPLHPKLRAALEAWIAERVKLPRARHNPALFLNHRGGRLSARGTYSVLKAIAVDAGLSTGRDGEFTPHVLRHTAGTTMIRDGEDIVTVAELLGHSLETARRYSLPTHADKQRAIERLTVDE